MTVRPGVPKLERIARARMVGAPVWLAPEHTATVVDSLRRTSALRGWCLLAVAVMRNHVHLVVGVAGDPDPAGLLRVLKANSSRALNTRHGRKPAGRWWTQSGSRRVLRGETAVSAAARYVLEQYAPLVVWRAEDPAVGWAFR